MKLVIQRVSQAEVQVKNQPIGKIGPGLTILLGVAKNDSLKDVDFLVNKIIKLRIMPDSQQKMNLSIKESKGQVLVISQFTLLADTNKGNRPSFANAASPDRAVTLYDSFISKLQESGLEVKTGKFGAMMQLSLTNHGPVTILLDSHKQTL